MSFYLKCIIYKFITYNKYTLFVIYNKYTLLYILFIIIHNLYIKIYTYNII